MTLGLRPATPMDAAAVTSLLARSYPVLLAAQYDAEILAAALPRITRARPSLLSGQEYYLLEHGRALLAAGGWSREDPWGAPSAPGVGHIRHVVTDPSAVRCGHGRRVLAHVLAQAASQGVTQMECYSTLTAVPFYEAMGFLIVAEVVLTLSPGVTFPAVHMRGVMHEKGRPEGRPDPA